MFLKNNRFHTCSDRELHDVEGGNAAVGLVVLYYYGKYLGYWGIGPEPEGKSKVFRPSPNS